MPTSTTPAIHSISTGTPDGPEPICPDTTENKLECGTFVRLTGNSPVTTSAVPPRRLNIPSVVIIEGTRNQTVTPPLIMPTTAPNPSTTTAAVHGFMCSFTISSPNRTPAIDRTLPAERSNSPEMKR